MKILFVLPLLFTMILPNANASVNPQSEEVCGQKGCYNVRVKLKRYAYLGSIFAQKLVAQLYIDGIGVEPNAKIAKRFLEMASWRRDPGAAMMILELYQGKLGNDPEKQAKWLRIASKHSGQSLESLKAMNSFLTGQLKPDGQLSVVLNGLTYGRGLNSYGTGSHIMGHTCSSRYLNGQCKVARLNLGLDRIK